MEYENRRQRYPESRSSSRSLGQIRREVSETVVLRDNTGSGRGFFQISYSELNVLSSLGNRCLKDDPLVSTIDPLVPIDGSTIETFCSAFSDGRLLSALVNLAQPGTIDTKPLLSNLRALGKAKVGQQVADVRRRKHQATADLNAAIAACKKINGVKVVNASALDFVSGKPTIILGLVWQLVIISILNKISIGKHPEIIRLKRGRETLKDLLGLPVAELLMRWVNWHLYEVAKNQGSSPIQISNFTGHLRDCRVYNIVLMRIDSSFQPSFEESTRERAMHLIKKIRSMGVHNVLTTGRDIDKGRGRMNEALLAQLFDFKSGLVELSEFEFEQLLVEAESLGQKSLVRSLQSLKKTKAKHFALKKVSPFPAGLAALQTNSSITNTTPSSIVSSPRSTSSLTSPELLPTLEVGGKFLNHANMKHSSKKKLSSKKRNSMRNQSISRQKKYQYSNEEDDMDDPYAKGGLFCLFCSLPDILCWKKGK